MPSLVTQILFDQLPKASTPGKLVSGQRLGMMSKLIYGPLSERVLYCLHISQHEMTCRQIAEKVGSTSHLIMNVLRKLIEEGLIDAQWRKAVKAYSICPSVNLRFSV